MHLYVCVLLYCSGILCAAVKTTNTFLMYLACKEEITHIFPVFSLLFDMMCNSNDAIIVPHSIAT